ncbi:hypothetical protein OAI87_00230 [Paracoccaceae bacterium]|nr:hypothetical protein [Paracoccaceae bacterium]
MTIINPLSKPDTAISNTISIYLDNIVWDMEASILKFSVGYLTDSASLTGLGLRLHFDSTQATYVSDLNYSLNQVSTDTIGTGFDNILTTGLRRSGQIEQSDVDDYDNSNGTNKFIKVNWAYLDENFSPAWPGLTNTKLYDINFIISDASAINNFGFSAAELPSGYSFDTKLFDLSLLPSGTTLKDTTSTGTTDLPDVTINLIDAASNSTAVGVTSGSITITEDITFTHVILESTSTHSYTSGVTLSDVGSSLRHVVGLATLTGEALQAADVDNDGTVSLSDVGSSLRHVVGLSTINTYDLVDGNGELVTDLGPSNDVTILYLVENGDVSLDGGFVAIA